MSKDDDDDMIKDLQPINISFFSFNIVNNNLLILLFLPDI